MARLLPADARAVAALERLVFPTAWSGEQYARELAGSAVWGVGAFAPDGTLAGYVVMSSAADECEVATIAVQEVLRGRKIASNLLARALQEARKMHIKTCFLEVATGNVAARALYASAGFGQVGRRRGYYAGGTEDALILKLDLTV